ncbi:hypothetical protein HDU98_006533 [Podochytrium sp. JEL0797]|nr:hypothetical protein HDU98_006533 [Podochytrium sp. JEL0797]
MGAEHSQTAAPLNAHAVDKKTPAFASSSATLTNEPAAMADSESVVVAAPKAAPIGIAARRQTLPARLHTALSDEAAAASYNNGRRFSLASLASAAASPPQSPPSATALSASSLPGDALPYAPFASLLRRQSIDQAAKPLAASVPQESPLQLHHAKSHHTIDQKPHNLPVDFVAWASMD